MRAYWVESLTKLAYPVLKNLAEGTLKQKMPRENASAGRHVCYLEALGRTLCGLAPWLEATGLDQEEYGLQQEFATLTRGAIASAVDPKSPDYLDFGEDYQNIVDAAFLAQGILGAPNALWNKLDEPVKRNLVAAMKKQRVRKSFCSNWLCFSAIIEIFLQMAGETDWDPMRVDYAIRMHETWYLGDGFYGDGPSFAFNYYNSYVIQPMLVDMLRQDASGQWTEFRDRMFDRAKLFARHQERMIQPEGYYPVIGRSVCYRYGAFHHLARMSLYHMTDLPPASVRCALEAVIRRVQENKGMFDENGWLTVGVLGRQKGMAEAYVNTGSTYLASTVFLPLGLSPEDPFWKDADEDWSSVKIWKGEDFINKH